MEQEIRELLDRFYEGQTTLAEEQRLRIFFSRADLDSEMAFEKEYFTLMLKEKTEAGSRQDIGEVILNAGKPAVPMKTTRLMQLTRVAAAAALVIAGYWLGYQTSRPSASQPAISSGNVAVQQLLSLDQPGDISAGDRILAVHKLAARGNPADTDIQVLINTLHFDPNVNVRMAALKALQPLASEPVILQSFIHSLSIQRDPVLQAALIESLAGLSDRQALQVLRDVSEDEQNLELIRKKADEAARVITANEWLKSI